ncbi:hypothetical protein [Neorhizobium alkalisoli]|uniref:Glycine-rich cell wall protein n=1 Tax=Neorhizobium alkalisoli TaxID=528178 RepID=A0A561QVQ7_9HYPH|nr:hypothetical protein [Neorhizobium alkalisoli]TWF54464.1 hypothetical protein FHW37_103330 [Neorhizobium alkalisoli]
MTGRRQFILWCAGGLIAAALAPSGLDFSKGFAVPAWSEAHADKGGSGGGSGHGGGNSGKGGDGNSGNGGGNSSSAGGRGNSGEGSASGKGSQDGSSAGAASDADSGSGQGTGRNSRGNASGDAVGADDAKGVGGRAVSDPTSGADGVAGATAMPSATANTPGGSQLQAGRSLTVRHANGTTEKIVGGRYEMRDSRSRTIVNRQATGADLRRLETIRP